MKAAAHTIRDAVACHPADRSEEEHFQPTVIAEVAAVSHCAGNQKCNVALDSTEGKNRINSVLRNDLREFIHTTDAYKDT